MPLELDYYYGNEAEQYSFYRIPKVLFTDSRFKAVSVEAKVLYGLLLDRMALSVKNGWMDEYGRVYIIYTISDILETLGCAEQKANKLLGELDSAKGIGLIERKWRGLGKPQCDLCQKLYRQETGAARLGNRCGSIRARCKDFSTGGITGTILWKSQFQICENHKSRNAKITNK